MRGWPPRRRASSAPSAGSWPCAMRTPRKPSDRGEQRGRRDGTTGVGLRLAAHGARAAQSSSSPPSCSSSRRSSRSSSPLVARRWSSPSSAAWSTPARAWSRPAGRRAAEAGAGACAICTGRTARPAAAGPRRPLRLLGLLVPDDADRAVHDDGADLDGLAPWGRRRSWPAGRGRRRWRLPPGRRARRSFRRLRCGCALGFMDGMVRVGAETPGNQGESLGKASIGAAARRVRSASWPSPGSCSWRTRRSIAEPFARLLGREGFVATVAADGRAARSSCSTARRPTSCCST